MALTTEAALRKDRTSAHSTMEHRHFATIADILSRNADLANHGAICRRMAAALASTNPKFDNTRFLRACGVES